jgi:hypothetical protein
MSYVAKFNPVRCCINVINDETGSLFALRLEDYKFDQDALDELGLEGCLEATLEGVAFCLTLGSDIDCERYAAGKNA